MLKGSRYQSTLRPTYALLKRMCSSLSLLRKSSADLLTAARSVRSSSWKIASFPVSSFKAVMAFSAFSLLRAARYTFALCCKSA